MGHDGLAAGRRVSFFFICSLLVDFAYGGRGGQRTVLA